jgi:hypothetical protein
VGSIEERRCSRWREVWRGAVRRDAQKALWTKRGKAKYAGNKKAASVVVLRSRARRARRSGSTEQQEWSPGENWLGRKHALNLMPISGTATSTTLAMTQNTSWASFLISAEGALAGYRTNLFSVFLCRRNPSCLPLDMVLMIWRRDAFS